MAKQRTDDSSVMDCISPCAAIAALTHKVNMDAALLPPIKRKASSLIVNPVPFGVPLTDNVNQDAKVINLSKGRIAVWLCRRVGVKRIKVPCFY